MENEWEGRNPRMTLGGGGRGCGSTGVGDKGVSGGCLLSIAAIAFAAAIFFKSSPQQRHLLQEGGGLSSAPHPQPQQAWRGGGQTVASYIAAAGVGLLLPLCTVAVHW
eukprot:TRINITY_DN3172_c1_g1_i1.p2 TRINITY_DN3172_c1_g1~~TRINITY_DN3172_c1_g1_i1.p2  ORF type:complete len:108 (-),score=1.99 TRINITY_DN3172_c1_g1_i1:315-638(-)